MRLPTLLALWAFAATYNIVILTVWWVAALNGWKVEVTFSSFKEHWLEGVIIHLSLLIPALAMYEIMKLVTRRVGKQREGGQLPLPFSGAEQVSGDVGRGKLWPVLRWLFRPVARAFSAAPR